MEEATAAMALLGLSTPSTFSNSHSLTGSGEGKSIQDEIPSQKNLKTQSVSHSKKTFPFSKENPKKQSPKPADTDEKLVSNLDTSPNQDFSNATFSSMEKENSVSENLPSDQPNPKDNFLRIEKSLEEAIRRQTVLFSQLEEAYREEKEAGVEKPARLLSEEQYRSLEASVKSLNKEVPELIRNFKVARQENERFIG